jgi:hypothetical protein
LGALQAGRADKTIASEMDRILTWLYQSAMITIRREQMVAFEAEQLREFELRLTSELGAAGAKEERARELAAAAMAKAKELGAESEEAIRTLARLMRLHGEAFLEEGPAWIAPGLADTAASGDEKVVWLGLVYRAAPPPAPVIEDDSGPEFTS